MAVPPVNSAWQSLTAEELTRLYWRQEMTDEEIGLMFGVNRRAVSYKRKQLGVPGRARKLYAPPLGDRGRALTFKRPFLR